jgi:hypothetical protein
VNLIDHESCSWKIDIWLKSSGVRDLKKGEAFSFREDEAKREGVRWVNPIGLRCHAKLGTEEYQPSGGGEKRKKNEVLVFYTDRAALARRVVEGEADETEVPF